jgi:hypothetical protein
MGANEWADSQPRDRARPKTIRASEPYERPEPLTLAEITALSAATRTAVAASGVRLRDRLIESGQLRPATPERLVELQEAYRAQQRERSAFDRGHE